MEVIRNTIRRRITHRDQRASNSVRDPQFLTAFLFRRTGEAEPRGKGSVLTCWHALMLPIAPDTWKASVPLRPWLGACFFFPTVRSRSWQLRSSVDIVGRWIQKLWNLEIHHSTPVLGSSSSSSILQASSNLTHQSINSELSSAPQPLALVASCVLPAVWSTRMVRAGEGRNVWHGFENAWDQRKNLSKSS